MPDIIETTLLKCMERICPQSITRETSAYLEQTKPDLDTCDGCPERDLCDRIIDLIKKNRGYYE